VQRCLESRFFTEAALATDNELVALSSELERLFDLDELRDIARTLLGIEPEDIGGGTSRGAFAKGLASTCVSTHRIPALCDAIAASTDSVDLSII
jgi:hypothetical protein